MLAHIPFFGAGPSGFTGLPGVPRSEGMHACSWGSEVLGCRTLRLKSKTAQALGCSLTPGLRISFRGVTCTARGASVPGLWTLAFLLLCAACV